MRFPRRHLRLCAIAWLVFQAASLLALVPRECCVIHRPAEKTERTCHEPAGAQTPLKEQCSMRGTCNGPIAALALLSNLGVLPDSFVVLPEAQVTRVIRADRDDTVSRLESPDPPPPRT